MRNKIIIFICLIILMLMAIYSAADRFLIDKKEYTEAVDIQNKINNILLINNVIAALQKERGSLVIYYSVQTEERHSFFLKQRENTTFQISKATSGLVDLLHLMNSRAFLEKNIDSSQYTKDDIFVHYTNLIKSLMQRSNLLILKATNNEIKNKLIFYQFLNLTQEHLGQLRAKIGSSLAMQHLSSKDYQKIVFLYDFVLMRINGIKKNSHFVDSYKEFESMLETPCFMKTLDTVNDIREKSSAHSIVLTATQWFNVSTCAIDSLHDYLNMTLTDIQKLGFKNQLISEDNAIKHFLFLLSLLIILIVLFIVVRIRSKELEKGQKLLLHYKQAIDHSSIVSKTDSKGIITYTNDAFCDVSGYTRDELIGKNHNIVRHPDMHKSAFKDMWQLIGAGKQWRGKIKNLKKDGGFYWVDASITPIYDNLGTLVEYIAIRHDITDIVILSMEIQDTQRELIYKLGEAVESRSKETGNHVRRVAHYSKLLAKLFHLNDEECETIFAASTMHDIGKISIPDSILLKKGKLTDDEWTIMKTHSEIGYKILKGSKRPLLKIAADIAYEHHEHYNGKGYPLGIKGEEISIFGRIVAIADVFDALANKRVYKEIWPLEKILDLLKKESGKQFDSKLIEIFLENIDQFIEIRDKFED